MKATMLKTVRAEAGLGSPPQPFTTNASETTNSVIKAHVKYAHSQLMEFVNHLKDVVDEQEREVERAVIKRGKFRFKEEYSYLEVGESQWFNMTPHQRQIHMKKVASTRVGSKSANVTCPQSLSVDVSDVVASTNLPLPCFQGIWSKATELLQAPGSIVAAPGHPANTWMVASRSGQRPHLVAPCKGELIKCDNECLNYKSMGICSHSVAVAQLNNKLQQFVNAFSKVKRKPNFTSLAVHGMPSGRGRKGGQAPRARKKASEPVTDRTERLSSSVSMASHLPAVGEMNNSTMLNLTANYPHGNSLYCQPSYQSSSYSGPGPSWMYPYFPECYSGGPYNCTSPLASQPPPQPSTPVMAEESTPFNLCFIAGNISKCAGCGNKYTKPVIPPHDLCIQHREWRSFTPSGGGSQQSKFAPAYYHVNLPCVRRNWINFQPWELVISPETSAKLTPIHRSHLASLGFFIS